MNDLSNTKKILSSLAEAIHSKEQYWNSRDHAKATDTDSASLSWLREKAYSWIYGDNNWFLLEHRTPESFNPVKSPDDVGTQSIDTDPCADKSTPEVYQELASGHYDRWIGEEKDITLFPQYIIKPPEEGESLCHYLLALHREAQKRRPKALLWQSLRSFAESLRHNIPLNEQGFLDCLFPREMGFCENQIIRKVPITLFPIDVLAVSQILENLVNTILFGRPNAQRAAAEALGFIWICLTGSRSNILSPLENLYAIDLTALEKNAVEERQSASSKKLHDEISPTSQERAVNVQGLSSSRLDSLRIEDFKCCLSLPSLHGTVRCQISTYMHDYLVSLPRSGGAADSPIFSSDMRVLRRALDKAVASSPSELQGLERITFLTFIKFPHEAFGCRAYHTGVWTKQPPS